MIRIRTRTDKFDVAQPAALEYSGNYPSAPFAPIGNGPGGVLELETSTITDEVATGTRSEHKCNNWTAAHWAANPAISIYNYNGFDRATRGSGCYWYDWQPAPQFSIESVRRVYPITVDKQLNDAMDLFYNTNEVDTLLNVVEAPQLPQAMFALQRTMSKVSVRNALSLVSSGYLAYSFGIAPLLADMTKVENAVGSLGKQLRSARMSAGKVVSVHVAQKGTAESTLPLRLPGTSLHHKMSALVQPTRIITVKGKRSHKFSLGVFQDLSYMMSRFGSRGPASFVWERIPFSFVVDWFLDLRGVCNHLDNLFTGSTKEVTGACLSEKFEVEFAATHKNGYYSSTSISPAEGSLMASSRFKYYDRNPIPATTKVIRSGRFGKKQLSLTAALLLQVFLKASR